MTERSISEGPTGVAKPDLGAQLDEDTREHLRTIAAANAASGDIEGFVAAIDSLVQKHPGLLSIDEQSRPATVRKELREAHEAGLRLSRRLNDLGGKARQLLYSHGEAGMPKLKQALGLLVSELHAARLLAEGLQRTGGPPKQYARVSFAALVARAIKIHLGLPPTTSPGGVFEEVLKTVVEFTERKQDPSVRNLMTAALRAKVIQDDDEGPILIDPRPD